MGDEEINGYDEIRNKIIKINIRMELKGLQPEALWHYFEEICRIPRQKPDKKGQTDTVGR